MIHVGRYARSVRLRPALETDRPSSVRRAVGLRCHPRPVHSVLDAAREELCVCLDALGVGGPWTIHAGEICSAAGTCSVRVAELHHAAPDDPLAHLDVGFAPDRSRAETLVWDCATGTGRDGHDASRQAARIWGRTTAPALLSFVSKTEVGDATFLDLEDRMSFPGWRCISGPYVIQGAPGDATILHQFLDARPLTEHIAPVLPRRFGRTELNGLKVFVGLAPVGRTLEVRINGERHERASGLLERLPWPEVEGPVFLRHFTLLVQPDWPVVG